MPTGWRTVWSFRTRANDPCRTVLAVAILVSLANVPMIASANSPIDGDVYNLILHKGLHPKPDQLAKPAEYDTGDRRLLERDSTIDDIADFVVDYINSG